MIYLKYTINDFNNYSVDYNIKILNPDYEKINMDYIVPGGNRNIVIYKNIYVFHRIIETNPESIYEFFYLNSEESNLYYSNDKSDMFKKYCWLPPATKHVLDFVLKKINDDNLLFSKREKTKLLDIKFLEM